MNKKLLTLAVAAALAAPGFASAEAIMYGKMNVSLDYETIDNVIAPVFNNTAVSGYNIGDVRFEGYPGDDIFVGPTGNISPIRVQTGAPLTQEEANALRGYVRVAPGQIAPGQDFKGWGMSKGANLQGAGRANRLGVKGSEDLGNGLKAVYQIEIGVEFDTNNNLVNNNDTVYWRNTFAGLAGDWGTVLMGRHDTPMKISTSKLDLFSDTMADYNGTIGFQDLRADNTVAYISPNWSGFQLAVATIPAGGATAFGNDSRSFNSVNTNINSDQINGGYSVAGMYKNGPFFGSLAYESINEEMYMNSTTSLTGCYSNVVDLGTFGTETTYNCSQVNDSFNKWRVGLGLLDWNGFTLTGIYENQDNIPTSDESVVYSDPRLAGLSYNLPSGADSRELWQIQAGYSFGNVMLKAMYGQTTFSGDPTMPQLTNFGETPANFGVYRNMADALYEGSTDSWAIGADYNFSKRTSAYILYTQTTSDQGDIPVLADDIANFQDSIGVREWDGFSIGMMHSF